MHDADFLHEHDEATEEARKAIAEFIWNQENIELNTVGIDIGSSTSHLLFAKVALQRQTQGLSSRFVVISREIVWRSPIMLRGRSSCTAPSSSAAPGIPKTTQES